MKRCNARAVTEAAAKGTTGQPSPPSLLREVCNEDGSVARLPIPSPLQAPKPLFVSGRAAPLIEGDGVPAPTRLARLEQAPKLQADRFERSVRTGTCALCGLMVSGRVFAIEVDHHERVIVFGCVHRTWRRTRFCLCALCYGRCYIERCDAADEDESWGYGRYFAAHCLFGQDLYYQWDPEHRGPCPCPGCGREVVSVNAHRARAGFRTACCDGHHDPEAWYCQRRGQKRLERRQGRLCERCGKPFTPKNALGKTCSARCRVALHRSKKQAAGTKAENSP
jgi:hypothetical protein